MNTELESLRKWLGIYNLKLNLNKRKTMYWGKKGEYVIIREII